MAIEDKYRIEWKYDDLLVAEAENLYDKNAIVDFSNPEKKLFVFVVHDGNDQDVELFKPFTKVQKSTCTCSFHQKHKICKHVIAALFFLRNQKENKKTKPANTDVKKLKTLNTRTILQFVEREELIQFVQQYAKSDPRFALQLKVHFARKVDLEDNRAKYKMLLDSIIPPNTGKKKPSHSELRAFLSVTEDLMAQIQDNMALEQFEEALHVLEAGFYKFSYVYHHFGRDSEIFNRQYQGWHELAASFLSGKIPYQVKKDLITFLKGLGTMSFYHFQSTRHNVVTLLAQVLKKADRIDLIADLKQKTVSVPEGEKPLLLALICKLEGGISFDIRRMLDMPGFAVLTFIQHVASMGQEVLALEELEKLARKPGVDKNIYPLLATLYQEGGQFEKALDGALLYYTLSGDYQIFTPFRQKVGIEVWKRLYFPEIEKKLTNDPTVKPGLLSHFLQKEEEWEKLVNLLYLHGDVVLLQSHVPTLYKARPEDSEYLWLHYLNKYLEDHKGIASHEFLGKIFRFLDSQSLFLLKKNIILALKKAFQDRPGLKVYLESLP